MIETAVQTFAKEIAPLVTELAVLKTEEIPFSPEVIRACERNACGQYGKTWQCPPGIGTLEERQALCLSYRTALVLTTAHPLEDSFDIDGMFEGKRAHGAVVDQILARLPDALQKDHLVFSTEGCSLCSTCTYPDAPCRYPERARPSVEANGIFVVELARQCNLRYHNGVNTVTYFSMLLFR